MSTLSVHSAAQNSEQTKYPNGSPTFMFTTETEQLSLIRALVEEDASQVNAKDAVLLFLLSCHRTVLSNQ